MARSKANKLSSPAEPSVRRTRAAAAAIEAERDAGSATPKARAHGGKQKNASKRVAPAAQAAKDTDVEGNASDGTEEAPTPVPRKSARRKAAAPAEQQRRKPTDVEAEEDVEAIAGDVAPLSPKKRTRRKVVQDAVDAVEDAEDPVPAPKKRTRRDVSEAQGAEDDSQQSASVAAPPQAFKHSRTATFGLKEARPVQSMVAVEIPLSTYSTPTARNRRFLKSMSDSGSEALPSSSPVAEHEAGSSDDESPRVDDSASSVRPLDPASPPPPPMFNMNLVQRARARAALEKEKEQQRLEAFISGDVVPTDQEPSEDDDAGSSYSQGAKERLAKDLKARKNGEEVFHTEDEDAEDEAEFLEELSKAPKTYKGKRTAVSATEEDIPGDDEVLPPPAAKAKRGGFAKSTSKKSAPTPAASPAVADTQALASAAAVPPRAAPHSAAQGDSIDGAGSDDDDEIGALLDGEDVEEDWAKTVGPLSKAAKEAARELGRTFNREVTELARKYGKDRRTIMKYTGTTLQATRGANSFCKYSMWYKHHHPMPPSSDPDAPGRYRDEIAQAYHTLIDGLNSRERERVLRPKLEWATEFESGRVEGIDTRRSAASMMQAGMEQLEDLCRVYETHDITILGAIISTSQDPAARQMSKIFGTDQSVIELVAANQINLNRLLDRIQNCIICQNYSLEGIELPLPKDGPADDGQPKEKGKGKAKDTEKGKEKEKDIGDRKKRDGLRLEAKQRFLGEIRKSNWSLLKTVVPSQTTVPWTYWPNFAFLHKVGVRNYPQGIPVIGSGFSFKNLTTGDLEILVNALQKKGDDRLQIFRWSEGDLQLAASKDKSLGRVGLVIDTDGRLVRRVIDSGMFSNSQEAGASAKSPETSTSVQPAKSAQPVKKRKAGDNENDVDVVSRPVAPLPRRGGGVDGNPVPRKRKRVEEDVGPSRPSGSDATHRDRTQHHSNERAHAAVAHSAQLDRALPVPPLHRRGEDIHANSRTVVASRHSQAHRVEDSMGPPPAERSHVSALRTTARMLPGPGYPGGESTQPRRQHNVNVDGEVRIGGMDLAARRELRRKTREDRESFIESFGQPSPPRPVHRVRQQSRQRSVGLADSDADLPEGPGEMRRLGGFTDAYGRYYVAAPAPARRSAAEYAQQQREAGVGHRRVSAPSRRPESYDSAQPGPSSLAGGSRPRSRSGGLQPIREYERYRRRDDVYVDEDIDDDMGLAPDVPHQWDYDYEDGDAYTQ